MYYSLQWCHMSFRGLKYRQLNCLSLFGLTTKKTSRVLCEGKPPWIHLTDGQWCGKRCHVIIMPCHRVKIFALKFGSCAQYSTLTHCGLVEAIWWHTCRSGSTLAQAMACRLAAPSHYMRDQSWLFIKGGKGPGDNFTRDTSANNN